MFYYQVSDDPVLGYEMKRNYTVNSEHGRLHLNAYGLRDDDDAIPTAPRRVALLGDSVIFGVDLSQNQIVSAHLQQQLDPTGKRIKVVNFGVPGYAAPEVARFFEVRSAVYHPTEAFYLVNPNDFATRDSRFEGADGGLYRYWHPPLLATPMMVRKAIYRFNKAGSLQYRSRAEMTSIHWYEWMYRGNRDAVLPSFERMQKFADAQGIKLTFVLYPAAIAYKPEGYALAWATKDLKAYFDAHGMRYIDPTDALADKGKYFDQTDHFIEPGSMKMAEIIREAMGIATPATAPTTTHIALQ
jgi:hypothetical protein